MIRNSFIPEKKLTTDKKITYQFVYCMTPVPLQWIIMSIRNIIIFFFANRYPATNTVPS